ncbi:MAG: arginine--tRNA ligase [Flavobacteriaceae bacterium]|nr:arginine--tRNA ligase [Flavobacteriaceae bacterium]MBD10136.1 arginine--tRNA ligase [Flavobacteriaceae bacterium]|tara:strand:- start:3419 stop:5524 length:2106 start_codon:yes stop_codon:yes gene_type:complete
MKLQDTLELHVKAAVKELFQADLESVEFQVTRKEFAGDITVVVFPMLRVVKGNPVAIGEQIGQYLKDNVALVKGFNVVKGFLNIEIDDSYYIDFFNSIKDQHNYGFASLKDDKAVMVEYSSPNTNKPLHLGHVRNVLLGYSVSEILKASGKKVYKTQIINDRGIHICKSMLAWQRFGNGETPESTGLKGDKLVGNYYVKFDEKFRDEVRGKLDNASSLLNEFLRESFKKGELNMPKVMKEVDQEHNGVFMKLANIKMDWLEKKSESIKFNDYSRSSYDILYSSVFEHLLENEESALLIDDLIKIFDQDLIKYFDKERVKLLEDLSKTYFSEDSKLQNQAQEMLRQWEAGDKEVVALWEKMNGWVYEGFEATYKAIGVDFDEYYYESQTYLLGKEFVAEGLKSGVFFKKEDGSVWCDLTDDGLDEKIVLRADGTAVYMTQDIGTAIQRIKDYPDVGGMVYTVGNEQDYHFKVLFLILKKLGFDWAKNLYHLSYGMVDLPSGKMKSREGTVVDADDLIQEMADTAEEISKELGKLDDYSEDDKKALYKTIGLGALKYYILKVDPKKRILFDPKESIDFQGNTGPFIQYTYARIQSILRKSNIDENATLSAAEVSLQDKERDLLKQLEQFPEVIQNAAEQHSPALVANYTYDLVKDFNSFYQNVSILGADKKEEKIFRVQLSKTVGQTIKNAFSVLGIDVPERM